MASMTIRNLKEETKRKIRLRAAQNNRSMEAEARLILDRYAESVEEPLENQGLGSQLFSHFRSLGGVELDIPPRDPGREPPSFD